MQTITLDGFEVSLFRDEVGTLRIEIDSSECSNPDDLSDEGERPRFELTINHEDYRPHPSGTGWQVFLGGVGWDAC